MSSYLLSDTGGAALLIEECEEGVFLYALSEKGVFDSWHINIEEAKAQAAYNHNAIVGPWRSIPQELGARLKSGETRP